MYLWRGNSYTTIEGAPASFLSCIERHLAIPIQPGKKVDLRFGTKFWHESECWGSMVHRRGDAALVPAGLTAHVIRLARHYGVSCGIHDNRVKPEQQYPLHSIKMASRPYQDKIHEACLRGEVGVIDAPPRSGKTLMAAKIIDSLALNTLIIAPSVAIVRQTYRVLCGHFGDHMVSRLDGTAVGGERDIEKTIVVATAASAVKQDKEFFDTRDILIIDEFHHSAAVTYHQINALAENIYWRFCFTGTHWRTGTDQLAMEAICSQVLYRLSVLDLVPKYLAQPKVFFIPFRGETPEGHGWQEVYQNGIVHSEERNEYVANLALCMQESGLPTIILTRAREHADLLGEQINDSVVVKGNEGALTSESVDRFLANEFPTLIGTTVLGEGVDLPNAATVIYASGGKESVQMMQSYYRPFTAYPGKEFGRVYDFRDMHHPTLRRHAKSRLEGAQRHLGSCVTAPD